VVEVAAMALRLSCLLLATPKRRKLLVLDEPLKALHGDDNRERARQLIETLARELKVQIFLTSGTEWLRCGKVIEIGGG